MADTWLEGQLNRQLSPVVAPDGLWDRIHEQRRPLRVRPNRWPVWCAAVAVLLLLASATAWRLTRSAGQAADLESLASAELRSLADGTDHADFHSDDPNAIRQWARERLQIDLRLPNSSARVLGVRMIRLQNCRVAAVTYRVGKDFGAMLVTDRPAHVAPANSGHEAARIRSANGVLLSSWSADGQDYTIAFGNATDPHAACALCHAGPVALVLR